jgi:hypothetical protein
VPASDSDGPASRPDRRLARRTPPGHTMRSALSVALVSGLVAAPTMGCATVHGPRQANEIPYGTESPLSNWSRVSQLTPGSEVVVTLNGSAPVTRYFVYSNQTTLTVLNLAQPALPSASVRVLRGLARNRPENLAALESSGGLMEGDVRVGRDGIVVANHKVAELGQVVEKIARDDVAEIQGTVVARGSVFGAVIGAWLGFAIGVVPGLGGVQEGVAWSFLIGSVAIGASLGNRWSSHETQDVVYQAP